ncbi:MAG: cysteine--tRNA ligase [Thermodesulfobacteriota bacterium]
MKPSDRLEIEKYGNILDRIGRTPLAPIIRINPYRNVTILAKLEMFNPGGSIKDRVALAMIEAAEETGGLKKGMTVLEATSGNTGIGLALVSAVKGYRCMLVMSESASIERRRILEAFGTEIILTPANLGTDGAIEEAYALAREYPERYFMTDQFNNENNWKAHYTGTGPEIWEQTGGQVSAVVMGLGTTGTAMGVSRYIKEQNPAVKIIGVEPYLKHRIQGLKNMKESYKPGIFDKNRLDEIINIHDEEAFAMARRLAKEEGFFVGMSSGAAMAAALEVARRMEKGIVVTIFPDGGDRYLSTDLFAEEVKSLSKETASQLKFYNTLTRKKEVFESIMPGKTGMYSCGPTAYELAHLGNCRRFIATDLIRRYLEFKGYAVTHIMNITDIDDKTIQGSEQAGLPLKEFTERYIREFMQDIDTLGVLRATVYPRATEHVEDMLAMTRTLLEKGYAYEKHHSIYYDLSKFPHYGRLSRIKLDKIKVGTTVDLDEYEKDNPMDFTLLKRSSLSELKKGIFYKTEWGNLRPGWHIECAAMSLKYLGPTFDVHTSGSDLIFPHHENEIAIAEAFTGKAMARYWLHSALVMVNGKKMSRSAGNFITLRDLLEKGYTGREVRFLLLFTHYRKPLRFSYRSLDAAQSSLWRLDDLVHRLNVLIPGEPHPEAATYVSTLEQEFTVAMDDDLNVAGALATLFNFIKKITPIMDARKLDRDQIAYTLAALKKLDAVLGVMDFKEEALAPEIAALIEKREEARERKDWALADQMREQLSAHGIMVIDTPRGPIWRKK